MHVVCICTHLISGASAVSLVPRPEDRLFSSSLRSFSGPPCFLYSACALLFQQRAGSAVTFDSTFLFEAPPLFARVTSRTRLCHIDDRPPKLHFENFNIDYPLDLLCCEKYKCIFTTGLSLFNKYKIYGTTYEYIHTYIHTYRHRSRSTR